MTAPLPVEIRLLQQSNLLELVYEEASFRLPAEFLRVMTPSAEARGHAPGQETLQWGKRDVRLLTVEPVGHYALRLIFSDGHDTGLYTWELLYNLGRHQEALWETYLRQLSLQGKSRDPEPATQSPSTAGACRSHQP